MLNENDTLNIVSGNSVENLSTWDIFIASEKLG